MFFAYGFIMKVVGYGPAAFADYIVSVGYPALLAYYILAVEVAGAVMLVLGLWARWVSLAALPILLGVAFEHFPNGWVFSNENGGWSYPAFWAAILVVQILLGDGAHALKSPSVPSVPGLQAVRKWILPSRNARSDRSVVQTQT